MRLMTEKPTADWISGQDAADIIGVSRSTVYRTLADPNERATVWGAENVGWRYKPLTRRLQKRQILQVSRTRAEAIARGEDIAPSS